MVGIDWRRNPAFLLLFRVSAVVLASAPLVVLIWTLLDGGLGPDPGQAITESLGLAAFQLLLATLCMTPLSRWSGWSGWLRIRRMLGLFAFFYASLHVLAFLQFIVGWFDLWATFTKRPYIMAGAVAFLCLVPLAVTSTRGMVRRLGGARWKRLHRLIYLAVVVAWVHFVWQARSDIGEMVYYAVIVIWLLALRWQWSGWAALLPFKR
ncbi:protein-methionine-sulfoxide reductase heme-binding subunit MsrQ [Marinobacter sp. F4206]|uniref:sulfite oxidase heme-binding subunit YedZ n=1 Tax=Marinobacter sp. F4206 TaxID=2861777 RepID=UPI001C6046DB|nr:protein-methionine-sulfoxide reductase heme-binding subunit MsrQ [Marinobacter sp. F4206]MBW4936384.1 sulfoxide reductase heme-binding subunit YedZ [Marinobacter sp. F4206]